MPSKQPNRSQPQSPQSSTPTPPLLSTLKSNPALLYRIHVLLYDLHNIKTNPASESRTLATTDELYISAPYFTASHASLTKSALIPPSSPPLKPSEPLDPDAPLPNPEILTITANPEPAPTENTSTPLSVSVETAIKPHLNHFFEKRRASGDTRPCGPHDLAPIYEHVFGVQREELADEKFLARLRRCGVVGLGEDEREGEVSEEREEKSKGGGEVKKGGRGRKGGKGRERERGGE